MKCQNCGYEFDPTLCTHCKKGKFYLSKRYARDEDGTCIENWACSWCSSTDTIFSSKGYSLPSRAMGYECPKCYYHNRGQATFNEDPDSGGCYLTSACVGYFGKEDNCYELEALRKFRDKYLAGIEGGRELIEEYYEIAPKIVSFIDQSPKKSEYYEYIYEQIKKCILCIENNDNENALTLYKNMTNNLKGVINQ